mmetsp:Transcript_26821/g.69534  ORF Transcript_26821/g.69534 Transcript_26821/m.69534 type:complete len:401 (-) Transcript_26821:48-1250(-)
MGDSPPGGAAGELEGVLRGLDVNTLEELDRRVKAVLGGGGEAGMAHEGRSLAGGEPPAVRTPATGPPSAWLTPGSDCSAASAFYEGYPYTPAAYEEEEEEEELGGHLSLDLGRQAEEDEDSAGECLEERVRRLGRDEGAPPLHGFGATTPEVFEHKLHMLASSLEAVEARSEMLAARVEASESESAMYAASAADKEAALGRVLRDAKVHEEALLNEVARLQGVLEAQSLSHEVAEETLRHMISSERRNADRLRSERDEAHRQRAEALVELGETASDMEAMQAALTDCATYCQFLRERCTALEAEADELARRAPPPPPDNGSRGVFGLDATREAIQQAVKETAGLSAGERKKQIRQLQLRWHPDKNPVLRELAGEVSKLINEAAASLEAELAVEERARVDG